MLCLKRNKIESKLTNPGPIQWEQSNGTPLNNLRGWLSSRHWWHYVINHHFIHKTRGKNEPTNTEAGRMRFYTVPIWNLNAPLGELFPLIVYNRLSFLLHSNWNWDCHKNGQSYLHVFFSVFCWKNVTFAGKRRIVWRQLSDCRDKDDTKSVTVLTSKYKDVFGAISKYFELN